MIGFNHAAVGGLLAAALPLPLALPLAFLSHFVLDALPHYGIPHDRRDGSRFWRLFGTADVAAALVIVGGLSLLLGRYDIILCGLVAASPDLIWVARIVRNRSYDLSRNSSWFTRMHVRIQRWERPWGIYIELPLAVLLFFMLRQALLVTG